jgi:hypothetical protein
MNEGTLDHAKSCSLAPDDLKARLAWIAHLNARALISSRRSDLELILEYRSLAARDVEQLIEHEQSCCNFLSFRLDKSGERLLLTIIAPDVAREAATDLFDHFVATSVPAEATSCCAGGCSA